MTDEHTEGPGGGPNGIRASNADRDRVASILRTAGAEGLLTLDEMDQRLAEAYSATYRHDLDPLVADLPDGGRPLFSRSPQAEAERDRLRSHLRGNLILHAIIAAAAVAAAFTLWAIFDAGDGWDHHHHFFPGPILAIAVISLAIHARRARWHYHGHPYCGGLPRTRTPHHHGDYWA